MSVAESNAESFDGGHDKVEAWGDLVLALLDVAESVKGGRPHLALLEGKSVDGTPVIRGYSALGPFEDESKGAFQAIQAIWKTKPRRPGRALAPLRPLGLAIFTSTGSTAAPADHRRAFRSFFALPGSVLWVFDTLTERSQIWGVDPRGTWRERPIRVLSTAEPS